MPGRGPGRGGPGLVGGPDRGRSAPGRRARRAPGRAVARGAPRSRSRRGADPAGPPLWPGRAGGLPRARRPAGPGQRPGRELPRAAGGRARALGRDRAAGLRPGGDRAGAGAASGRSDGPGPGRWRGWRSACSAAPRRRCRWWRSRSRSGSRSAWPWSCSVSPLWRRPWRLPGATGPEEW